MTNCTYEIIEMYRHTYYIHINLTKKIGEYTHYCQYMFNSTTAVILYLYINKHMLLVRRIYTFTCFRWSNRFDVALVEPARRASYHCWTVLAFSPEISLHICWYIKIPKYCRLAFGSHCAILLVKQSRNQVKSKSI
jgi:hypothetical protein